MRLRHAVVVLDQPRSLKSKAEIEERMKHLDDEHISPLNEWVRDLRRRLGALAVVPWFDPMDGGTAADVLWLLEAPGPKATRERGGSGFISCNNNDGTAENTWRTRVEAGIERQRAVHWNAIPYYLGSDTKIRAFNRLDVADVRVLIPELLELLPRLSLVILGGKAADAVWTAAGTTSSARVVKCSHPSPTNLNTRPHLRAGIVDAWRQAELGSGPASRM